MADARDNHKEAERRSHETEPRSIEEPKENEDLGFGTNERGRIYYYNESHEEIRQYLQQLRLIDDEMQRRSHETESRSIEEPKVPTPDMRLSDSGRRSDERTDGIQKTEPSSLPMKKDKEDSVLRITEADQIRDYKHSNADTRENLQQYRRLRDVEMQRRRRETECWFRWCRNGRSCRYNHPTQLPQDLPERICVPICKYFLRKYCKFGSVCEFQHIKDRDGAEPMYQARSTDWRWSESEWRFDERTQRRYEIEYSEFRLEKRAKTILDSGERDSRERFEVPEEGEIREQENPQEQIQRNTERQGTEAQHNLQSKIIPDSRLRDPRRHATEWRFQRESMEQIERQRREAQYNLQEQRSGGEVKDYSHLIDPIVSGIIQEREAQVREQRQRDSIERQRREPQENLQQQGLQEMSHLIDPIVRGIKQAREAQLREWRQRDSIERQRREPQENLQQQGLQVMSHLIDPIVRGIMQTREAQVREWRQRDSIERQRREPQENLQQQGLQEVSHLIDKIERGIMQAREGQLREQRQRDSIERQRREPQENLQQQGLQEMSHLIDPIVRGIMQAREAQLREWRQRDSIERQRREPQENLQQQGLQEMRHLIDPIVRGILQAREAQVRELIQRDSIERQRRDPQENLQQQGLQEMPENQNVDAHHQQNTQELGFKRKEGDGVLRGNRVTRPPKRTFR